MVTINKNKSSANSLNLSRFKITIRPLAIICLFIAICIIFFCYLHKDSKQSLTSQKIDEVLAAEVSSSQSLNPKQEVNGLPLTLKIPEINVSAKIEHLGLLKDGTMDISNGPFNVAWYKFGPKPGDIGSAVIAGHYGTWKNGDKSVFDNLNKLHKGDQIQIEDVNNAIISFIVKESKDYDPKANASEIFDSKDGKSHLNLITCEGTWNNSIKSYSQRLVIFADKSE